MIVVTVVSRVTTASGMIVVTVPSSGTPGVSSSTGLLVTPVSGDPLPSGSSLDGPREGGDWDSVVISTSSSASIGRAVTSISGVSVLPSWLTEGTVDSDSDLGVVISSSPGSVVDDSSSIDLPSPSTSSSSMSVFGVVTSSLSVMSSASSSSESISASVFVVVVSPSSAGLVTSTPVLTPASSGRSVVSTSDFGVVLSMSVFGVVASESASDPTVIVMVSDSESVITVVTSDF